MKVKMQFLQNQNVIQNNDIYIYIEKNDDNKKQETIKSVKLENITIAEKPEVGEMKIYKPISNDSVLFENKDENIVNGPRHVLAPFRCL